jgi:hypothetical protein
MPSSIELPSDTQELTGTPVEVPPTTGVPALSTIPATCCLRRLDAIRVQQDADQQHVSGGRGCAWRQGQRVRGGGGAVDLLDKNWLGHA